MSVDYDKLRAEESDKSSKLQELMSVPPQQPHSSTASVNSTTATTATNKHRASSPLIPNTIVAASLSSANKTHKNQLNNSVQQQQQLLLSPIGRARTKCIVDDDKLTGGVGSDDDRGLKKPPVSLFGQLCHTVPLAMPTLQLHLLISLTLVWLTHRCPQYLIIL